MGDLLKDQKKVDFSCLANMARAYEAAFGPDISSLLDGQTQQCHDLGMLEALRNLFAHQAGVVDQTFIRRIKKFPKSHSFDAMAAVAEKQSVPTTGLVTGHLTAVAIEVGVAVISAVDDRLVAHDGGKMPA